MDAWGQLDDAARQTISERTRTVDAGTVEWLDGTEDDPVFVVRSPWTGVGDQAVGLAVALDEPARFRLIPPAQFDYDVESDAAPPEVLGRDDVRSYVAQDRLDLVDLGDQALALDREAGPGPGVAPLPPVVDHRNRQSSVRHQGVRGTCVSHATCAVLEAMSSHPDDLSEQMMHYQFMEHLGLPHHLNAGIATTDAPTILQDPRRYTCREDEWAYEPSFAVVQAAVTAGTHAPPPGAVQSFGIANHTIIGDRGLEGESIKNTRYLESLLAAGYDIAIGAWASWQPTDVASILAPLLDLNGEPVARGGHAMVVVGYDRPRQFFILKNSWGIDFEHGGYGYFSYDFVRSCFKYGFIVTDPVP